MKTDGKFTLHKFEILIKKWDNKPIYLIPIGDVHRNSPNCAVDRWLKFCEWAKGRKDCFYITMGDLLDLTSTTERRILNNSDLHESTIDTIEDMYNAHINNLCKEMDFAKGRLIGMLGGNHYIKFISGITSTQKMCEYFKCKYLGVSSFIRVIIKDETGHSAKLDIYAHHGLGGGRTVGASLGKLENSMKGKKAEIYLQGHDHSKGVITRSRLGLSESHRSMKLIHDKIILARTGSFLRGYVDGKSSYIADADYNPAEIGVIKISITPKRNSESRYLDIHASV